MWEGGQPEHRYSHPDEMQPTSDVYPYCSNYQPERPDDIKNYNDFYEGKDGESHKILAQALNVEMGMFMYDNDRPAVRNFVSSLLLTSAIKKNDLGGWCIDTSKICK